MRGVFILNARTADRSGGQRVRIAEEHPPIVCRTLVLFIHGFNVDRRRAIRQAHCLEPILAHTLPPDAKFGAYLWPSDRLRVRFWSRLTYPSMAEPAEEAGALLGDYLLTKTATDVVLVGQSLGALVAVSAALRVRSEGERPIGGLVLTGAAIRAKRLMRGSPYGVDLAQREAVLYSPTDRVLGRIFRLGERLTGPFFPRSDAVGLTGEPRSRGWCDIRSGVDHHEYWREKITATGVANGLRSGVKRVTPRRYVSGRTLPSRVPLVKNRFIL